MGIVQRAAGAWQHLVGTITADDLNRFEGNFVDLDGRVLAAARGRSDGYDKPSAKADGPVNGRARDDGLVLSATGSALPYCYGGRFRFQAGTTVGNWYILPATPVAAPVVRMRGRFRLDPSDSGATGVCFGLFDANPFSAATVSSPWHCSITTSLIRCSSFANGITANEVVMRPYGFKDPQPRWHRQIPNDGVTWVSVEAIFDKVAGVAWLIIEWGGETEVREFRHENIKIDARYPFLQFNGDGSGIGEWDGDAWGWDLARPDGRAPWAEIHTLARVSAARGVDGAGSVGDRPSSRRQPGSTYTVAEQTIALTAATAVGDVSISTAHPVRAGTRVAIDTGTAREVRTTGTPSGSGNAYTIPLTAALSVAHASGAAVALPPYPCVSDGTSWRDASGVIVSNRMTISQAACLDDGSFGVAGSAAQAIVRAGAAPTPTKWRSARVRRITATAGTSAAPQIFVTYGDRVPVEPGEPLRLPVALFGAQDAARLVSLGLRCYNAAGTQLVELSGAASSPAVGDPVALGQPRGVAPAGSVLAEPILYITAAAGERFYLDGMAIALAHGADVDYVRL